MFKSKPFYYKITGKYALFTDPATKGGGEKQTYQIPTYQALKGITEQIYWKPSFIWYVDEFKVINKIDTESKGTRTITFKKAGDEQDRSYYTYLKDPEYYVKVHFEWNENRDDLKVDRNEIKHQQIMLRSLEKGGRRDVFLGVRECFGYIEKLTKEEYENNVSYYKDKGDISFGIMFHSFIYPDEAFEDKTYNNLTTNYQSIQMKNGFIKFNRPDDKEASIYNIIRPYPKKDFNIDRNLISADTEWNSNYSEMAVIK